LTYIQPQMAVDADINKYEPRLITYNLFGPIYYSQYLIPQHSQLLEIELHILKKTGKLIVSCLKCRFFTQENDTNAELNGSKNSLTLICS
jgi:hypothetical protein